jgi:hypothetical protein
MQFRRIGCGLVLPLGNRIPEWSPTPDAIPDGVDVQICSCSTSSLSVTSVVAHFSKLLTGIDLERLALNTKNDWLFPTNFI